VKRILVSRPDLSVYLPPIGCTSVYIFGDPDLLGKPATPITCRMHDECDGSDVFGSDLCTCRPYLSHGIDECIRIAQSASVEIRAKIEAGYVGTYPVGAQS